MFRLTLYLFVLSCLLTGYRRVGQPLLPLHSFGWSVRALSGTSDGSLDELRSTNEVSTPIPTIAPLFRTQATEGLSATTTPNPTPTVTIQPGMQLATTTTADAPSIPLDLPEILIYDDELSHDWTMAYSVNTQYTLWDTTHWFQQLDPRLDISSGATAIAVSPQADYGTLFFAVRPESPVTYKRSDVLGVSFWLNSGSDALAKDDLAVAVIGSNQSPYWTPGDLSVFPDNAGSFSETRLYHLQVNRAIPADTWINVIVWLNKLAYDPAYEYVTGFYIKNDIGFRNNYYIDRVALIMAP